MIDSHMAVLANCIMLSKVDWLEGQQCMSFWGFN